MVIDVSVGWNIFRLLGDFLHLAGMLLGLFAVWSSGSVEGFSRKTQVLFQTVYVTRYLDVFTESQSLYLYLFKAAFNVITAGMLMAFVQLHSTFDASADSCNLVALMTPAVVFAIATALHQSMLTDLWTFSELLEPFALVPQYMVCYRAPRVRFSAVLYVLAVGGYRVLYVLNWMYKRYVFHGAYHDYTSWIGGFIECVLFFDFVVRITQSQRRQVIGAIGASPLGRVILSFDDMAGRVSEKVEMQTIGRRLPFGLTGPGSEDEERQRKQWDVSDRIAEEEGCQLLTMSGDADCSGY